MLVAQHQSGFTKESAVYAPTTRLPVRRASSPCYSMQVARESCDTHHLYHAAWAPVAACLSVYASPVCMGRFAESFQSLHSAKLQAAEKKSVEMFMNGDMPAVRGKKKRKPMTEVGFVETQAVRYRCATPVVVLLGSWPCDVQGLGMTLPKSAILSRCESVDHGGQYVASSEMVS